mmetsp:Transcript_16607/g.63128  ORF Transcript_16607/g.63128 Transcript_16607/m.63128 type:complete len:101 (+) Transcript_16607:678-980(+)
MEASMRRCSTPREGGDLPYVSADCSISFCRQHVDVVELSLVLGMQIFRRNLCHLGRSNMVVYEVTKLLTPGMGDETPAVTAVLTSKMPRATSMKGAVASL